MTSPMWSESGFCVGCGAALPRGSRFCNSCGAPVAAVSGVVGPPEVPPPPPEDDVPWLQEWPPPPPLDEVPPALPIPPVAAPGQQVEPLPVTAPTSTTSWWKGRRVLTMVLGGAAITVLAIGFVVTRDGDNGGGAAPTTGPTAVAASPGPTSQLTAPPTVAPTESAPASTAGPAPGSRYIGLTFPNGVPPTGVRELSGALIGETGHATSWMGGPEGDMFWLLREAGTDEQGSVTAWEVMDVVVWPPVTEDSAQVVTGGVRCDVDGAPVEGVAAVFPLVDEEWFTDPYAAWWADTRISRFVALPAGTRCQNEGYGV